MEENKMMVKMPAFEFHVQNTPISGVISAANLDEAKELLKRIHLGPKKIIKFNDCELIQACKIDVFDDELTITPQMAFINGG